MTNLDSEHEKGPAIFKEEIIVEDHPVLQSEEPEEYSPWETTAPKPASRIEELRRQESAESGGSTEYVPEITDVEYDQYLMQRRSPGLGAARFESEIVDQSDDNMFTQTAPARLNVEYDVEIEDARREEREERPEITFENDYQLPKDAFGVEKPYGLDLMSVRTEDEVSELPDSEIASLMSDRKAELERRDSDVSLSDREYSDKDDENVVISDTDSESPLSAKSKPKKKTSVSDEDDKDKSESSKSSVSDKEEDRDEKVKVTEGGDMNESFDDESESLGVPSRVYGGQYLEEINKLQQSFTHEPKDEPAVDRYKPEESKAVLPERNIIVSPDEKSETSSSESESDEEKTKKAKKYILEDDDNESDRLKDSREVFEEAEEADSPRGDYPYGSKPFIPKLQLKRESSDSDSDAPFETEESNLDITTDLETTVDLETTAEKDKIALDESIPEESPTSEQESAEKSTTDDSSTIKEEFITRVDSLDQRPLQIIEVRDYVSSDDDVPAVAAHVDIRSESPEIETGFANELDLSCIAEETEEAESDEESESSSTSADSVRHVEIPLRDDVLHTVPEEPESADVSMEVPREGEISDTSFDVEESLHVEGPLARSTLGPDLQSTPLKVMFQLGTRGLKSDSVTYIHNLTRISC